MTGVGIRVFSFMKEFNLHEKRRKTVQINDMVETGGPDSPGTGE